MQAQRRPPHAEARFLMICSGIRTFGTIVLSQIGVGMCEPPGEAGRLIGDEVKRHV